MPVPAPDNHLLIFSNTYPLVHIPTNSSKYPGTEGRCETLDLRSATAKPDGCDLTMAWLVKSGLVPVRRQPSGVLLRCSVLRKTEATLESVVVSMCLKMRRNAQGHLRSAVRPAATRFRTVPSVPTAMICK